VKLSKGDKPGMRGCSGSRTSQETMKAARDEKKIGKKVRAEKKGKGGRVPG